MDTLPDACSAIIHFAHGGRWERLGRPTLPSRIRFSQQSEALSKQKQVSSSEEEKVYSGNIDVTLFCNKPRPTAIWVSLARLPFLMHYGPRRSLSPQSLLSELGSEGFFARVSLRPQQYVEQSGLMW
jgi:hypothetical protein